MKKKLFAVFYFLIRIFIPRYKKRCQDGRHSTRLFKKDLIFYVRQISVLKKSPPSLRIFIKYSKNVEEEGSEILDRNMDKTPKDSEQEEGWQNSQLFSYILYEWPQTPQDSEVSKISFFCSKGPPSEWLMPSLHQNWQVFQSNKWKF